MPPVPPVPPVRVPVPMPGAQPRARKVQPPQSQLVAARTSHELALVLEVLLPELTAQEPRSQHPGRHTAGRAWRPALAVSTVGT